MICVNWVSPVFLKNKVVVGWDSSTSHLKIQGLKADKKQYISCFAFLSLRSYFVREKRIDWKWALNGKSHIVSGD